VVDANDRSPGVVARASLDRYEEWIARLETGPLDFYEYEAMLLHRERLADELELAGRDDFFVRVDELDARLEDMTEEVASSPFAPGSGEGSTGDALRQGWWWQRLPTDPESRAYTLLR
jgi:hypothetical protein